ncbi:MAG: response regulator transcription factor [Christensenellales bacterium]|jgi:two-component system response regulator VicR
MPFRILAVDDEPLILKGLRFSLEQDGYLVEEALDGQTALEMIQATQYDLVLLDVMLPVVSGTDVLRQMREFTDTPVIMLTAKGDDMDRILGLEYGADDYMVKPFNILEVKARMKSVLRRTQSKVPASHTIQFKNLVIDPTARSCMRDEREINLTVKEFNLLMTLAQEPTKVFSREQLHQALWKSEKADGKYDLRTVDVHIRRLREKIEEDPARPSFIMTKWGVGYYFADR